MEQMPDPQAARKVFHQKDFDGGADHRTGGWMTWRMTYRSMECGTGEDEPGPDSHRAVEPRRKRVREYKCSELAAVVQSAVTDGL